MKVRLRVDSAVAQDSDAVIKAMVTYGKISETDAKKIINATLRVGFSKWYEAPIPETYFSMVKDYVYGKGFHLEKEDV